MLQCNPPTQNNNTIHDGIHVAEGKISNPLSPNAPIATCIANPMRMYDISFGQSNDSLTCFASVYIHSVSMKLYEESTAAKTFKYRLFH